MPLHMNQSWGTGWKVELTQQVAFHLSFHMCGRESNPSCPHERQMPYHCANPPLLNFHTPPTSSSSSSSTAYDFPAIAVLAFNQQHKPMSGGILSVAVSCNSGSNSYSWHPSFCSGWLSINHNLIILRKIRLILCINVYIFSDENCSWQLIFLKV